MPLTTCPDCHNSVSDSAPTCPHCGKPLKASQQVVVVPQKKKTSPLTMGCAVLAGLFLLYFIVTLFRDGGSSSSRVADERKVTQPSQPTQAAEQLEVLALGAEHSSDYMIVSGEVKNVSSESLKSVKAVVSFYDAQKKFVNSCDAIIKYDPVLAGQTSPFEVYCKHNPAMHNYNVAFTTLWGSPIGSRDARTSKK